MKKVKCKDCRFFQETKRFFNNPFDYYMTGLGRFVAEFACFVKGKDKPLIDELTGKIYSEGYIMCKERNIEGNCSFYEKYVWWKFWG